VAKRVRRAMLAKAQPPVQPVAERTPVAPRALVALLARLARAGLVRGPVALLVTLAKARA